MRISFVALIVLLSGCFIHDAPPPKTQANSVTAPTPPDCLSDTEVKAVYTKDKNGKNMLDEVISAGLSGEALWQSAVETTLYKKYGNHLFCGMQEGLGVAFKLSVQLKNPEIAGRLVSRFEPQLIDARRRGLIKWVAVEYDESKAMPFSDLLIPPDAGAPTDAGK